MAHGYSFTLIAHPLATLLLVYPQSLDLTAKPFIWVTVLPDWTLCGLCCHSPLEHNGKQWRPPLASRDEQIAPLAEGPT